MERSEFKIEVCANSVESVKAAIEAGADRVELCAGMPEGGTTPSFGCIRAACGLEGLAINVIIRPRGGDFLYSQDEKEVMLEDIRAASEAGADGIVSGILLADGQIDRDFLCRCIEAAYPLPFTFHRAFDMCRNPFEALEVLKENGCTRLLSSGMKNSALEGAALLRELVQASGDLIVMPGCGINAGNIRQIAALTGAREFHLSGRSRRESGMLFRNTEVSMGGTVKIEEYARDASDTGKIRQAMEALTRRDTQA